MKKKITKIANQAANESFIKGRLSGAKVSQFTKLFKTMPKTQVILYLSEYAKALRRIQNQSILKIESASKLSNLQKNKIASNFKKEYSVTKIETELNPDLLGGVRIKLGDIIFEDSVNLKISQLGEAIENA